MLTAFRHRSQLRLVRFIWGAKLQPRRVREWCRVWHFPARARPPAQWWLPIAAGDGCVGADIRTAPARAMFPRTASVPGLNVAPESEGADPERTNYDCLARGCLSCICCLPSGEHAYISMRSGAASRTGRLPGHVRAFAAAYLLRGVSKTSRRAPLAIRGIALDPPCARTRVAAALDGQRWCSI